MQTLEETLKEVERIEGRTEWWDTKAIAEGRDVLGGGNQDLAVMKSDDAQRLIKTIHDLVGKLERAIADLEWHADIPCHYGDDRRVDGKLETTAKLLAELKGQDDGQKSDPEGSRED